MRILLLNPEFPPVGGGAGRATYNIGRELAKLGHEVDILTGGTGKFRELEKTEGINVYRAGMKRKGIHDSGSLGMALYVFNGFLKYRKLLKEKEYDAVHAFFSVPTGIIPWLGKKLYGKNYIVSLRGSDVPGYDKSGYGLQHGILRPVNRGVWKEASEVVALSRGLEKLAEEFVPEIDYAVIGNGIDSKKFRPLKKVHSKNFRLVCTTRLTKRKGIEYLLEAVKMLQEKGLENIRLDIYGEGAHKKELESFSAKLGLRNAVFFRGYIKGEGLPEAYREADVFVLPSLAESFGLVFAESMACGLPIVASNAMGIPETVENNVNGLLVEPENSGELADALQRMAEDTGMREKMGKENRKKAVEKLTWKKVALDYLKIYESSRGTGK